MQRPTAHDHRLARSQTPSLGHQLSHDDLPPPLSQAQQDVVIDCGWGRLLMAHTFRTAEAVANTLQDETHGTRDIAIYVRDPHVVLASAPQSLFLDPSHTYRNWLGQFKPGEGFPRGLFLKRINAESDAEAIQRLYRLRHMVPAEPEFIWERRTDRRYVYVVAEDQHTGDIVGTVTGIDHQLAFEDPERGSSLWCLAVDPQTRIPGVGEALVRYLAEVFQTRGREYMDLSVLHDNEHAIQLYNKLGFQRVPVFTVKRRNAINERLFSGAGIEDDLNPYARLITNEARRRGIAVEILDAESGYFKLIWGGRSIKCRESLSELTSAVAMSRCQDKHVTQRVLRMSGLNVPQQCFAAERDENDAFLAEHGAVVVKPVNGEQGQGISVNITDSSTLDEAIVMARQHDRRVLLERFCPGDDLRIIVMGFEVIAAAVRRPPQVIGDGAHTVRELIEKQSRRRAAATGGESNIPFDAETQRCIGEAGFALDDILPYAKTVVVRKAANLHTGGTIHDVTARLSDTLRQAAIEAAQALDIPVVGLDFLTPDVSGDEYVIIEANERPGLANHEPQPTAERFIDLLFPQTSSLRDHA